VSAKLVGIAYSSWNPESKARVIASDATGSFRQEITLKPAIQYVVVYPGDRLPILTRDGGRGQIVLSVNEMSEQDAARWGLRHEPYVMPTRFRIIRQTGVAFAPNLGTTLAAGLHVRPGHGDLDGDGQRHGRDPGDLAVPLSALAGLLRVDPLRRQQRRRQAAHGRQPDPQGVGRRHGDGRRQVVEGAVRQPRRRHRPRGHAGGRGQILVCDIEVALVHPGNRLCGRYQGGL
jgi:hypothetical protein